MASGRVPGHRPGAGGQPAVDENFPDHYLGAVPLVLGCEIAHPGDRTRTHVALVNAYVHTPLAVALFKAEDLLLEDGWDGPLLRARQRRRRPRRQDQGGRHRRVGPVFGLNAGAWWARRYGHDQVLALDVGGTTAKLGVIAGRQAATPETATLLGVPLQTPWTLLRSAAVGGGASLGPKAGGVRLGPDSRAPSRARPATTSAATRPR